MQQLPYKMKNVRYELFIAVISAMSIVNVPLYFLWADYDVAAVIAVMDWGLSLIFLADFVYRLFFASSRTAYLLRQFGWADLLSAVPFTPAKALRLFSVFRTFRLVRLYGGRSVIRELLEYRGGVSVLFTLFTLIILVLEFGGMAIVKAESGATGASIKTAQDAMWFIYVTIATVGYGDVVPVTLEGRLAGIVIMTIGTALFGTLTGFLANAFLQGRKQPEAAALDDGTDRGIESASTTPEGTCRDPKASLADIKRLLQEQRQSQQELESRVSELEKLL
jgi:voltage-gated potassium channel